MARSFKKTLFNTLYSLFVVGMGLSAFAKDAEAKSKMTLKELKAVYGVPHRPDAKHAAVNALETKLLKQGVVMPSNDRSVYRPELVEADPGRYGFIREKVAAVTNLKGKKIKAELIKKGMKPDLVELASSIIQERLRKAGYDPKLGAKSVAIVYNPDGYVAAALVETPNVRYLFHFKGEGVLEKGVIPPALTDEALMARQFRLTDNSIFDGARAQIKKAKHTKHMAAHAKAAKKKVQKAKSVPEAQSAKVEVKAPAAAASAAGVNATGVNATLSAGMNATGAAPALNSTAQGNATNATSLYSREELEKFHNAAKNATKQAKMREQIEVITKIGMVYPIDSNFPKTPVLRNVPGTTNATNSSSGYVPFPNG